MRFAFLGLLLSITAANAATGISVTVKNAERFAAIDLYDRPYAAGTPSESVRLYDALGGSRVTTPGFDFTCIAPIADPLGNRFGRCTIVVSASNPDVTIVSNGTVYDDDAVTLRFVGASALAISSAFEASGIRGGGRAGVLFTACDGAFILRANDRGAVEIIARDVDLPDDH